MTLVYLDSVPGKRHRGSGDGEPARPGCLSTRVTSVGGGRSLPGAGAAAVESCLGWGLRGGRAAGFVLLLSL